MGNELRDASIRIRLTAKEKEDIETRAKRKGLKVSEYFRMIMLDAFAKEDSESK